MVPAGTSLATEARVLSHLSPCTLGAASVTPCLSSFPLFYWMDFECL